jgi:DNA-binding transcriptional LysR family regulator
LPHVISNFSKAYPAIRIRVVDESMNQVLQSVLSGESDFGIGFMGNLMPEIEFEPIHNDPFVVAMRREHPYAERKSLVWADLEPERLIAVARSSGNRQLLDDVLAKQGLSLDYAFEVSHMATLLGMVEAGLGLALVPRMALSVEHPSVKGIPLRNLKVERHLGLLRRRGGSLRPAAVVFHQHLHKALKSGKAETLVAAPPAAG